MLAEIWPCYYLYLEIKYGLRDALGCQVDKGCTCDHQFYVWEKGNTENTEKDILFKRRIYSPQKTLEELSNTYHISKERVRQIELNSINKLKKNVPIIQ